MVYILTELRVGAQISEDIKWGLLLEDNNVYGPRSVRAAVNK